MSSPDIQALQHSCFLTLAAAALTQQRPEEATFNIYINVYTWCLVYVHKGHLYNVDFGALVVESVLKCI